MVSVLVDLSFAADLSTDRLGGQPIKASVHTSADDPAVRLQPVTSSRRLRITFNGSVSDVLPWKFTPQQREVRVLPGRQH
jgi:cytochrome c oxidase assembly protein subunit 11